LSSHLLLNLPSNSSLQIIRIIPCTYFSPPHACYISHSSFTAVTAVARIAWLAGAGVWGSADSVQTAVTHGEALCLRPVRRVPCTADVHHSLPDLGLKEIGHRRIHHLLMRYFTFRFLYSQTWRLPAQGFRATATKHQHPHVSNICSFVASRCFSGTQAYICMYMLCSSSPLFSRLSHSVNSRGLRLAPAIV
jgi:hypothetical protein